MTSDPLTHEQVHQYFVQKAPELLSTLEHELHRLQQSFQLETINNLMRAVHTLKGSARSIGLETIRTIAKSLEDIFRSLCHADQTLSSAIEPLLFETVQDAKSKGQSSPNLSPSAVRRNCKSFDRGHLGKSDASIGLPARTLQSAIEQCQQHQDIQWIR